MGILEFLFRLPEYSLEKIGNYVEYKFQIIGGVILILIGIRILRGCFNDGSDRQVKKKNGIGKKIILPI